MDGVNELDETVKISNLMDPDPERQPFGRKSQNWPNLRDENGININTTQTGQNGAVFYFKLVHKVVDTSLV
ncbi:hypothetical protein Hanom_Chr08g00747701 [Helianthus anomalus]